MKFRTKLLIGYLSTAVLITGLLAAFFFRYGENKVRQSFYEQLLVQTKLITENLARLRVLTDRPQITALVNTISRVSDARITVVAREGTVIADSASDYRKMANHGGRPEFQRALQGDVGYSIRFSGTLRQSLIYVAYPLRSGGRIIGAVRLARNQVDLDRTIVQLRWIIFGGVGLILLFPLVLGVIVLNRMTQPVLELQRMAERIARGDLTARIRLFGSDELAELGLVFNSMAQQLADSFHTIRDEKQKLEVILGNMVDGIIVIDHNLKIRLVNRAAQNILGFNARFIQGRPILEGVLNHHLLELIEDVNRQKAVIESELQLHYPQNRQLQVFLAPLQEPDGVLFGSIVVLHDMTQIRRLERVRQDFVANVSHELRTPLTAVKAMTETLLGGAWRDEAILLRYLEAINNESDRLTFLINDLLALAKLDSKTRVTTEAVDLVKLIEEIKERFVPLKGETPVFEVQRSEQQLPMVEGNRDQLKQVLINLLDNAFKYTSPNGRIRISAWPEAGQVKVAVADTGIGIPPDDLDRIFERFYRVDKARSREIGGTGLGLSIVKNIVEAHGGRVEVESTLNRGSVFSFTVPVYEDNQTGDGS
ncbi:MAG TPA: ATP-binding protein [Bacillota bacterium]|nr:ATP-binding protein [Bacillota bacterium]